MKAKLFFNIAGLVLSLILPSSLIWSEGLKTNQDIDPFRPFIKTEKATEIVKGEKLLPTQKLKISEISLKGIIWRQKRSPLALIEDSTGRGYIIKVGDPLGLSGWVKTIKKDRIVVEERYVDIFGNKKTKIVEIALPKKEEAVLP